jgi:hypothetical protein
MPTLDLRQRIALVIAMAAHVERNTPQVFPQATTDRLEDAADELLGVAPLSFETHAVVLRVLQALGASSANRPWRASLEGELAAYVAELGP